MTPTQAEFIGTTFETREGILTVVATIAPKNIKTRSKHFVLTCSVCSKDAELFPYKSITSSKAHLLSGKIPCACGRKDSPDQPARYRWKEFQQVIRIKRLCKTLNFQFQGFVGKYNGITTKLKLKDNNTSEEWSSTSVDSFLRGTKNPHQQYQQVKKKLTLPESEHIKDFLATNKYHKDTEFSKIEGSNYWEYTCLYCNTFCKTDQSSLKRGTKSCKCRVSHGFRKDLPASFYLVKWFGFGECFIKIGITNKPVIERVKQQARKSKLDYEILSVYSSDGVSVYNKECEIKSKYKSELSACPREWLPNGFYETLIYSESTLKRLKNELITLQ